MKHKNLPEYLAWSAQMIASMKKNNNQKLLQWFMMRLEKSFDKYTVNELNSIADDMLESM